MRVFFLQDATQDSDPTLPTSNCDWDTVVHIGSPRMEIRVIGPIGGAWPVTLLIGGSQVTFLWKSSVSSATRVSLSMWIGSNTDMRNAALVTTAAISLQVRFI